MILPSRNGDAARTRAWLGAALATAVAPVILYFIARSTVAGLPPTVASAVPPMEWSASLRLMLTPLVKPDGRISEQHLAEARKAAATKPLAFEPFLVKAKAEEQAGRLDRAIVLAEEARRRRPNFPLTRMKLMGYYPRAGRLGETLQELDFVLRRSPKVGQLLLPEMGKLVRDPEARNALATLLAKRPPWRETLLNAAKRHPIRPQDALALLNSVKKKGLKNPDFEQNLYVHSLVANGQYRQGRAVALAMLPEKERSRHPFLFDGSFRGVKGTQPYAWTLYDTPQGRAEIAKSQSEAPFLDINYFGGSSFTLAEQTLALPPGRYQIRAQAKTEEGIRSGEIYWAVLCVGPGTELGRLSLAGLEGGYKTIQAQFAVPSTGCTAQQLRLISQPGEVSAVVDAQLASLEILSES